MWFGDSNRLLIYSGTTYLALVPGTLVLKTLVNILSSILDFLSGKSQKKLER